LDFRSGRFYGLDSIGTRMIQGLVHVDRQQAVENLISDYQVRREEAERDLEALALQLEAKGLLVPLADRSAAGGGDRTPSDTADATADWRRGGWRPSGWTLKSVAERLCRAILWLLVGLPTVLAQRAAAGPGPAFPANWCVAWWLTCAWLSLRLLGVSESLRLWRRWHLDRPVIDPAQLDQWLERTTTVVQQTAARRVLMPAVCKERALVGHHILRAVAGLPAELVFGIEFQPFLAHAWVECQGRTVTDDQERCRPFVRVARYH
jgi:hypothetical protein